jgi:hypothetical protein
MKMKTYIDQLIAEGYRRSAILNKIKELCGLKSTRAIENWLTDYSTPDVYKAQAVAAYLSQKFNRRISVSDLWPMQELREAVEDVV